MSEKRSRSAQGRGDGIEILRLDFYDSHECRRGVSTDNFSRTGDFGRNGRMEPEFRECEGWARSERFQDGVRVGTHAFGRGIPNEIGATAPMAVAQRFGIPGARMPAIVYDGKGPARFEGVDSRNAERSEEERGEYEREERFHNFPGSIPGFPKNATGELPISNVNQRGEQACFLLDSGYPPVSFPVFRTRIRETGELRASRDRPIIQVRGNVFYSSAAVGGMEIISVVVGKYPDVGNHERPISDRSAYEKEEISSVLIFERNEPRVENAIGNQPIRQISYEKSRQACPGGSFYRISDRTDAMGCSGGIRLLRPKVVGGGFQSFDGRPKLLFVKTGILEPQGCELAHFYVF